MEDLAVDACEETCSICLESFTKQDPATITVCNHEYHLQCIMEWSQRSRECPICWRSLALSDPVSQELLSGVEVVRPARRQTLPVRHFVPFTGFDVPPAQDQDPEDVGGLHVEYLRQHVDAIMSQAHRLSSGREGASSLLDHTQELHPPSPSNAQTQFVPIYNPYSTGLSIEGRVPAGRSPWELATSSNESEAAFVHNDQAYSDSSDSTRTSPPSSPPNQRFSEFASFSGSLKSKLSAASSRYRDSLSKGTRSFKEMLTVHNNSFKELSKEVKHEVTTSFAGVARMMARLDLASRSGDVSSSNDSRGTPELPCEDDGPTDKPAMHSSEVPDARKVPVSRRAFTQVHNSHS